MSRTNDPEELLSRVGLPLPPPELRHRALVAARKAAAVAVATPGPWSRLLDRRGLRLAWALCAIALVAAHLVLSLKRPTPLVAGHSRPAFLAASKVEDGELADAVRLERIAARAASAFAPERSHDNGA